VLNERLPGGARALREGHWGVCGWAGGGARAPAAGADREGTALRLPGVCSVPCGLVRNLHDKREKLKRIIMISHHLPLEVWALGVGVLRLL
jgi:hypothetical protein